MFDDLHEGILGCFADYAPTALVSRKSGGKYTQRSYEHMGDGFRVHGTTHKDVWLRIKSDRIRYERHKQTRRQYLAEKKLSDPEWYARVLAYGREHHRARYVPRPPRPKQSREQQLAQRRPKSLRRYHALRKVPMNHNCKIGAVYPSAGNGAVGTIVTAVCTQCHVSRGQLFGHSRHKSIVAARHIAIAAAHEALGWSTPELAAAFFGPHGHHTSAMHALNRVKADPIKARIAHDIAEKSRATT